MKEFLLNLLILLSFPFYFIGIFMIAVINLCLAIAQTFSYWIGELVEFIKSDYIEAYKILKGKFKNGRRKRKNKKENVR